MEFNSVLIYIKKFQAINQVFVCDHEMLFPTPILD